jgi:hypothetical protein
MHVNGKYAHCSYTKSHTHLWPLHCEIQSSFVVIIIRKVDIGRRFLGRNRATCSRGRSCPGWGSVVGDIPDRQSRFCLLFTHESSSKSDSESSCFDFFTGADGFLTGFEGIMSKSDSSASDDSGLAFFFGAALDLGLMGSSSESSVTFALTGFGFAFGLIGSSSEPFPTLALALIAGLLGATFAGAGTLYTEHQPRAQGTRCASSLSSSESSSTSILASVFALGLAFVVAAFFGGGLTSSSETFELSNQPRY